MIQRRAFIAGIGSILAAHARARGEEARAVGTARVGVLGAGPRSQYAFGLTSLVPAALRDLGWTEGRNITFTWRFADSRSERLSDLAADLVKGAVNVIVANANLEAEAAKRATSSIPIVVYTALDPVATGLVRSLARPGGNVTGVMWAEAGLAAKMVDLVVDAVPRARRLAILYDSSVPGQEAYADADEDVARARGLTVLRARVTTPPDVSRALTAIRHDGADALKVSGAGAVGAETSRIVEFATANRLPTIFAWPAPVERGGLMSYSPNYQQVSTRVAALIDKVLRGVKPADLPFEHPTRFDLVINLKTAKALGLTIPPSLLLRADQVIE